jgi:hypothetical protein
LIVVQRLTAHIQSLGQAGLDGAELDRLGDKELSGHLVAKVHCLDPITFGMFLAVSVFCAAGNKISYKQQKLA